MTTPYAIDPAKADKLLGIRHGFKGHTQTVMKSLSDGMHSKYQVEFNEKTYLDAL